MSGTGPTGARGMTRWSTDEQAPEDAVEAWRDARRRAYVEVVADPTTPDFHGTVSKGDYGAFALSTKQATGDHVRRGRRLIARGDESEEYLFFTFQVVGTGVLQQAGRTAVLHPGSFVLYDSSLPFTMRHEGPYAQVVVHLRARQAYALARLRRSSDVLAVAMECDGPMASVAAFFLNFAATQQDDPRAADYLAPHGPDLAATLLGYAATAQSPPRPDRIKRADVVAFIQNHLADPTLCAEDIARGAHMSRRSLYRLLSASDTSVMGLLRSHRIASAQRLLVRQPGTSVTDIARATGFASDSHFYRTFRAEVGMTPGDYREQNRP